MADAHVALRFRRASILVVAVAHVLLGGIVLGGASLSGPVGGRVLLAALAAGLIGTAVVTARVGLAPSPSIELQDGSFVVSHPFLREPMRLKADEVRGVYASAGGWWFGLPWTGAPHVMHLTQTHRDGAVWIVVVLERQVDLQPIARRGLDLTSWFLRFRYVRGNLHEIRALAGEPFDLDDAFELTAVFGERGGGVMPEHLKAWLIER